MSKLRPEYTVERLHERQKGKLPGLLGVRVLSLDQGMLSAELTVREELLAPNGFLHAATVIGLADTAAATRASRICRRRRAISRRSS